MRFSFFTIFSTLLFLSTNFLMAQDDDIDPSQLAGGEQTIEYAVPFLTIASDSRAGAMGDAGVATSPDINSMHWNPAKYAFIDGDMGLSVSYTPWLRNLVNDIDLGYLSYYGRLDDRQTVAFSLLYFSLGNIKFTNEFGDYDGEHTPYELAIDGAYARKFSERISAAVAFRFIATDLTGGATINGTESKTGYSVAADISMYYLNDDIRLADRPSELSAGLNIRNIGTKIAYTETEKDFIPTELRVGLGYKYHLDDYNSITLTGDVIKYLVPSSPIYLQDYTGINDSLDENGDRIILAGEDPNVSVLEGMVQSFYDAPGGLTEELHELKFAVGLEYWYMNQFAIRGGYFYEHQNKGNRKYFTVGIGIKLNVFNVDFSYLVPVNQNNPLANTVRFTLGFDFNAFREQRDANRL